MPNFFQRVANAMRNFANRIIGAGPQVTPVSPAPPAPPPEPYEEYPTPGMQEEPPSAPPPPPQPEPEGECNGIEYFGQHTTAGYNVLGRWCLLGGCPPSFLYEFVSSAYYENGEPDFLTFIVTGIPCEDSPTRALRRKLAPGEEATFGFVWGWEQVLNYAMKSASLLDFINDQMAIDPEHSDQCFVTITEICILDKRRA